MRYKVDWVPTFGLMLAAKEFGMPDGGNPLDYVQPEEANLCKFADDFDAAVSIARERLPRDFFGRVRIRDMETGSTWHVSDSGVSRAAGADVGFDGQASCQR